MGPVSQPQNCHQSVTNAWIALGANLPGRAGAPQDMVLEAFAQLQRVFAQAKLSPLYLSPAFPAGSGPDFCNGVARLEWGHSAAELLAALHKIERDLGRQRRQRWEARVVDLDLLALGDMVLPNRETQVKWRDMPVSEAKVAIPPELILPHPRMTERAFVLQPLSDLDPDWHDPVTGLSIQALKLALPKEDFDALKPL